jgi:hypothetical protein
MSTNRFFNHDGEIYLIVGMTCHAINKIEQFCIVGAPLGVYKTIANARKSVGTHIFPLDSIEEISDKTTIELIEVLYG